MSAKSIRTPLEDLRSLYSIGDYGRCYTCSTGFEDETQEWPCDTAELLWSSAEIEQIVQDYVDRKKRAWQERCDRERARVDALPLADLLTEIVRAEREWKRNRYTRALFSKLAEAAFTPQQYYTQFAQKQPEA